MGNGSVTCWAVRSATSGAGTPSAEKPVPDAATADDLVEGAVIGGMSASLAGAWRWAFGAWRWAFGAWRWALAPRPDELPCRRGPEEPPCRRGPDGCERCGLPPRSLDVDRAVFVAVMRNSLDYVLFTGCREPVKKEHAPLRRQKPEVSPWYPAIGGAFATKVRPGCCLGDDLDRGANSGELVHLLRCIGRHSDAPPGADR